MTHRATDNPDQAERLVAMRQVVSRDERIGELEEVAAKAAVELHYANQAIVTRDVIGMAKGIIIASLHCSPDEAFDVLVKQSTFEKRKLVAVAKETVERNYRVRVVR